MIGLAPTPPSAGAAHERPRPARGTALKLLDADPDLGCDLSASERAVLEPLVVPTLHLWAGPWDAPRKGGPDALGLLVVEGLLLRRVCFGGTCSTELVGPGDLLRPWLEDHDGLIAVESSWVVLKPTRLALLIGHAALALSSYPALVAQLLDRTLGRARRQAVAAAASGATRVDRRLLLAFGHLAERFGFVTPRGVEIQLDLTHATLAALVAARRPTVTTALGGLRSAGLVEKDETSARWILTQHGCTVLRETT